ncbi:hypothetical protein PENTCL1PPCAC_19239, partial [Pristionchus entomophagus]
EVRIECAEQRALKTRLANNLPYSSSGGSIPRLHERWIALSEGGQQLKEKFDGEVMNMVKPCDGIAKKLWMKPWDGSAQKLLMNIIEIDK